MDSIEKNKLAYDKIKQAKNILLITHERPDGDALASTCAISLLLDSLKKNYKIFCHDLPSPIFNFIPNIEKVKNDRNFPWNSFDTIIILDCGAISRTKLEKEIMNRTNKQYLIEFDHHPKTDNFSDLEIRIPQASSTSEIIYHLFKINNLNITKEVANCILTGIMTDTINFINPSTTPQTIEISSEMLKKGAQMPKINKNAWQNKNIEAMKTLGTILKGLKINEKYKIAFYALTFEDIKKIKEPEEALDSVMNFLVNIEDVNAIIFFKEIEKGKIKGSIRTNKAELDISKLAKFLGGGGHPKACGFVISGSIIKTKNSWKIIKTS